MAGQAIRKKDKKFWERKVRPDVVPRTTPTCSICGFVALEMRRLIHADEVWSFPGPPRVELSAVRPLCVYCHDAKHFDDLLTRIAAKMSRASLEKTIREHYCRVNDCSEQEFRADYEAALARKEELEVLYGNHCVAEVDYRNWTPPERLPRLTSKQRQAIRALYISETPEEYDKEGVQIGGGRWDRDEPIIVGDQTLKSFGMVVRYLQSLKPEDRPNVIREMQEFADLEDDHDSLDWVYEHNEALEPLFRGTTSPFR